MTRFFEHFPENRNCPICNTNEDKACFLMPIHGTEKGNICEAIPVHKECVEVCHDKLIYNRELKVIYMIIGGE
jgi:hypothetical protein